MEGFLPGDQVLVNFYSFAYGGEAVGRVEGIVIFCPFAAPGDEAEVEITEVKSNFLRGKLVSLLSPSPHRVEPICPLFGRCGGCTMQHINYKEQLRLKETFLRDALQRIGKFESPPLQPIVPSLKPLRYRSRARLHAQSGKVGFLAFRSHELVPVESCPVLDPALDEALDDLRSLSQSLPSLREITLRTKGEEGVLAVLHGVEDRSEAEKALERAELKHLTDVVWLDPRTAQPWPLKGEGFALEHVSDVLFRCTAHAFFQANLSQTEVLVRLVKTAIGDPRGKVIWDLYAGVGVLGLACGRGARKLALVESDPTAYADADWNVQNLRMPYAQAILGSVEEIVPRLRPHPDVVILDPPRTGCSKRALQAVVKARPQTIVYVSCDPPTFARDAGILREGGYELEWARPLDMFPQTHHVELVAKFVRQALGRISRPPCGRALRRRCGGGF